MAIIKNPLTIVQTGGGENKLPDVLNKTVTSLTAGDLIGVTQIPNYAFQNCIDLTSVEFSSTLQTIYSYAFYGCRGLTSITLPSSLEAIRGYAFYYCLELETLEYKGTIDQWLSIDFGSYWMVDSSHTFIVNGEELTNLEVPEGVTSIGDSAFNGCHGLTSITLPSSLEAIRDYAFYYCSRLSGELDLGNCTSLTSIGSSAFRYCTGLTSITLPSSLTSIGSSAFRTCTSLTTMRVEATTPPTLSNTNAISTATTKIYIPAGTLSAYQSATNWSNFADLFEELPS